jgi:hypothetical protein
MGVVRALSPGMSTQILLGMVIAVVTLWVGWMMGAAIRNGI